MKIAICSEEYQEGEDILELLRSYQTKRHAAISFQCERFYTREQFAMAFAAIQQAAEPFDLVIIAFAGAAGQEAAIQAKTLDARCGVLWISEDRGFARAGQRIGVDRFLQKPMKPSAFFKTLDHLWKCRDGQSAFLLK